jgi:hypothetical protein
MGRLYNITVAPAQTPQGALTTPASPALGGIGTIGGTAAPLVYTSVVNGIFNPAALLVEFDFFSYANAGLGQDGATITIHGVGLQNITQAQQFVGRNVQVTAGMSGGLPLENPQQAGLILNGPIFQSWANWVGTEMDLNFLVFGSAFTPSTPGLFVLNWQAGTTLQSALTTTLMAAYGKDIGLIFNLSQSYILGRNVGHNCATLGALSDLIQSTTATPGFTGVTVSTPVNNTIIISDNLGTQSNPKQINFNDLIGQPTWVAQATVMVTCVMRGDIQIGSLVMLPQGIQGPGGVTISNVSSTGVLPTAPGFQTSFQGQFRVQAIRHVGNSRDTGPTAWVTMLQCAVQPPDLGTAALSSQF